MTYFEGKNRGLGSEHLEPGREQHQYLVRSSLHRILMAALQLLDIVQEGLLFENEAASFLLVLTESELIEDI